MSATKIPTVGEKAPDFSLLASDDTTVSLDSLRGQRFVLYFYPKADTPGCTIEACGFRDAIAGYHGLNVPVYGVSPDPIADVKKFAKKFDLTFPLLADTDHSVCEKYGIWGEKTYAGNKYMGAGRATFIIDFDGRIAHVFENVKPQGHEKEVMDWLGSHV